MNFPPIVLDLSHDRRSSDASESSAADEHKLSDASSDGSFFVRRPSGLSAFQAGDETVPRRTEVFAYGGELLAAADDEKIAPRPIIAKDYAQLSIPSPALSRRGTSDRWADRLRRPSSPLSRPPSSQSLSAIALPRSPLASRNAFISPSTPDLGTPSYVGTPTEEMPFTNPWSRRPSKSSRTLDQAINFDRIRSPLPSPRISMPDISKVRELDAQRPDAQPYATAALPSRPDLRRTSSSSSSSILSSSSGEEYEDEEEYGLGPPPEVPPALEYVDPEIECVAPNASTVTLPQAQAQALEQNITHPWVEPPFNIVERKQPRLNKYTATFKIAASLGVVSSLLIGYGLGVKIVTVGPWSFGMYGLILILGMSVCYETL